MPVPLLLTLLAAVTLPRFVPGVQDLGAESSLPAE